MFTGIRDQQNENDNIKNNRFTLLSSHQFSSIALSINSASQPFQITTARTHLDLKNRTQPWENIYKVHPKNGNHGLAALFASQICNWKCIVDLEMFSGVFKLQIAPILIWRTQEHNKLFKFLILFSRINGVFASLIKL